MRLLTSHLDLGPFHGPCGVLEKAGDETELHEHPTDHMTVTSGALKIYALHDGREIEVECATAPEVLNAWLIRAHTKHKLVAVNGRVAYVCVFAKFDPKGDYWHDPKTYPGKMPTPEELRVLRMAAYPDFFAANPTL